MDTRGNAAARSEVAAIKVAAMEVAHNVVNRAVQTFGAAGVSDDTVLARLFAITRALQIADGPNEVHLRTIARLELEQARRDRTDDASLTGKVALVTGASRGLGLRHRARPADAGATVVVSSRKVDACERRRPRRSPRRPAGTATPLALHVGDWDAIEPAVDRIIAELGQSRRPGQQRRHRPAAPSLAGRCRRRCSTRPSRSTSRARSG